MDGRHYTARRKENQKQKFSVESFTHRLPTLPQIMKKHMQPVITIVKNRWAPQDFFIPGGPVFGGLLWVVIVPGDPGVSPADARSQGRFPALVGPRCLTLPTGFSFTLWWAPCSGGSGPPSSHVHVVPSPSFFPWG